MGKNGNVKNRSSGILMLYGKPNNVVTMITVIMTVSLLVNALTFEMSYAALSTSRQWGKEITDAKLNKYNGKNYYWKLPGVDQFACTGYTEWALNSVYGVKVPGYASTKSLRRYFINKGNKIVAYGSHVAKAQGGNGKYYSYGEIKPGDIVFFFRRGSNSKGKVTKSPIKDSRGYTEVTGWRHVAIVGGSVSGSHGLTSKLHHNTGSKGIHYSGTIKNQISIYTADKGATDYQVMRVIEPEKPKRAVKIIKTMRVNGNDLPEEKAVFRIWPKSYGKYSSKSSWWKKIPSEYKDQVTTDSKGAAVTKKLPAATDGFNGKYYIYQTKGPEIVKLAKNKVITLKKGSSAYKWSYTDDSSEHPSIVKKDAVTGETVTQEGITFRLKKKGAFQNLCSYLSTRGQEDAEPEDGAAEEDGVDADGSDGSIHQDQESAGNDTYNGNSGTEGQEEGSGTEEHEESGSGDQDSSSEDERNGSGSDENSGTEQEDGTGSGESSDEAGEGTDEGSSSGRLDLDDADAIVKAFLSDDPEKELADLGITIPDSAWASVGGQDEFITDETGTAEISAIGKDETGEYEIYETESPEGFKLPGYSLAAMSPESATDLDRPVQLKLDSLDYTAETSYSNMPEPEIGTSAADDTTESHIGSSVEDAGLTDTVSLENLESGKPYTIFGKLMLKETGEPLKDASGDEITASTVFTPEEMSGTAFVKFSFDGRIAGGKDVVVFERLYEGALEEEPESVEPLASHEDINDEDQTVSYPEVPEEEEPDEPEEDVPVKKVKKPKKPDKPVTGNTPKTGDDQLELITLLITVLLAAIVILVILALTYRDKSKGQPCRKRTE